MVDKHRLRVARCRNEQLRHGRQFSERLAQEAGLPFPVTFVAPEECPDVEDRLEEAVRQGLLDGSLSRTSALSWGDVRSALDNLTLRLESSTVVVLMCHFMGMAFTTTFEDFSRHAKELVELDGDTVWVLFEGGESGLGIDYYEEEGRCYYETDTWGSLRLMENES